MAGLGVLPLLAYTVVRLDWLFWVALYFLNPPLPFSQQKICKALAEFRLRGRKVACLTELDVMVFLVSRAQRFRGVCFVRGSKGTACIRNQIY
jgi:hypothetical protein